MEDNHPFCPRVSTSCLFLSSSSHCVRPNIWRNGGTTKSSTRVPKVSSSSSGSASSTLPPVSPASSSSSCGRVPAKITRVANYVSTGLTWSEQVAPSTGATEVFLSPVAIFFCFLVLRMCFNMCHSVSVPTQGEARLFQRLLFHFKSLD